MNIAEKLRRDQSRGLLALALIAIAVIWQLPYGQRILYPLTLFATYAHELGHGLTALLVGGEFKNLSLFADGSGLAEWHGQPGRMARALVAAGGLLGPTLAGVLLMLLGRTHRQARLMLGVLATGMVITLVLWVRNPFAIFFILAAAAFFLLCAAKLSDDGAAFLLHFVAALLCLSWFRDLDYMFSAGAVVDGVERPSDSAAIAMALWLPYWFWGGVVAALSLALVTLGFWLATRR